MNQQAKRIKELFGYARTLTKEQGVGPMCVRAAGFFKRRFFGKRARYWPSNQALEAQRNDPAAETFPIISILTPLYNTPQTFLTEFLDSVENQTARNWQLCLADASDDAHAYVGELVQKRAAANPRIRYVKIENKGIAANTNAAAQLAQGNIWPWRTMTISWLRTRFTAWAKHCKKRGLILPTAMKPFSAKAPRRPMWPTLSRTMRRST